MEHKYCPRCGAAFICQHENPAKCQCAGVELSPSNRAHLAAQYPTNASAASACWSSLFRQSMFVVPNGIRVFPASKP